MPFCYVVMCHTDPEGVLRLVRRVRSLSPTSEILVRYTDPGFLAPEDVELAGGRAFLSRTHVNWGDFSLVEAELEVLAVARAVRNCDHVVVISGQDYPVRDLTDWEDEVRQRPVDALLDPMVDQPDDHRWRWTILTPPVPWRPATSVVRRAVVKVGSLLPDRAIVLTVPDETRLWFGIRGRLVAPPVRPVKCAYWSVYNHRAIDSVLRQDHADPKLRAFFRHVRIPDEWYVPSLVCADPDLTVGISTTCGRIFPRGAPNPLWLDQDVLRRLRARTSAPFVRKVPRDIAPSLIEEADRMTTRTRAQVHADVVEPPSVALTWADEVSATVLLPAVGSQA